MPIATCPKCRLEFLAAEAIDQPQVCPACKERFLFTPAMAEVAAAGPAGKARAISPRAMKIAGRTTALLGLLLDATLIVGNIMALRESAGAGQLPRSTVLASGVLLLAALAHAALTVLAARSIVTRPRQSLLLARLAVACWLVLGGGAVLLGAHLWPPSLSSQWDLAFWTLIVLGVVLTYLGGLEWLSQAIEK